MGLHFWSSCAGRLSGRRQAKGLASFCFPAVPSALSVCDTSPGRSSGAHTQLPHTRRTHFWVPLREPSSSSQTEHPSPAPCSPELPRDQDQLFALSPAFTLAAHCSAFKNSSFLEGALRMGAQRQDLAPVRNRMASSPVPHLPLHPRSQCHMLRSSTDIGIGAHFSCHLDQGYQPEQDSPQWESLSPWSCARCLPCM